LVPRLQEDAHRPGRRAGHLYKPLRSQRHYLGDNDDDDDGNDYSEFRPIIIIIIITFSRH